MRVSGQIRKPYFANVDRAVQGKQRGESWRSLRKVHPMGQGYARYPETHCRGTTATQADIAAQVLPREIQGEPD